MADRRPPWDILPRPDRLHHTVEDFLTTWDAPNSHILPLRRFIESTIDGGQGQDLRLFFADTCMIAALTHQSLPLYCSERYMTGSSLERPSTSEFPLPVVNANGTSVSTSGDDAMTEPQSTGSAADHVTSQIVGSSL